MLKILIADDEHHVRRSVIGCLDDMTPPVRVVGEARDGEEFLALCRQHNPDLVLVDVMMPGMNGLDAAERVRELLPETRVVFLTAYDRFEFVRRALRLGAMDFLVKPVRRSDLAAVIRQLATDLGAGDESSQAEAVARAREYIDARYANPLSLCEVAGHVHVSPCHFSRVFRKVTGRTFSQYLLARRLEVAKRLLATTDRSCQAVSQHTGFRSCGHFSTVFKREVGMPPTQYRAEIRGLAAASGDGKES